MYLEIIVVSEVNQIKTNTYDITYIRNIKYDTNELIFGKKQTLWLPRGKVRKGWIGIQD